DPLTTLGSFADRIAAFFSARLESVILPASAHLDCENGGITSPWRTPPPLKMCRAPRPGLTQKAGPAPVGEPRANPYRLITAGGNGARPDPVKKTSERPPSMICGRPICDYYHCDAMLAVFSSLPGPVPTYAAD